MPTDPPPAATQPPAWTDMVSVFEAAPTAMILVSLRTGRIVAANEFARALFDRNADDLAASTIFELSHPEDRSAARHWFEEMAAGRCDRLSVRKRYLRRDGSEFWADLLARPVRRVGDEHDFSVGSFVDCTEQRRQELAVHENRERMRVLIDCAPAALALFDRDMKYLAASRRWHGDYELGGVELVGRSHYEIFPELSDGLKAVHRRAMAGEIVRADEDLFVRADGTRQWLRWEVRPWFDAGGAVGGIVIASEDVTARKTAETEVQMWAEAFTHSHIGQAISDARTNTLLSVNPAFARDHGYTVEELVGMPLVRLFPPSMAQHWAESLRQRFDAGPYSQLESEHVTKDGRTFPVLMGISLQRDADGRPRRRVAHVLDITQRREAEAKIAATVVQLEAMARGALRAVSTMVEQRDPYTAGHERRVGIISARIAEELGWAPERCRDLELVGLVHDIGKIGVPAEILTKPGRLSPLEFELVKTHAQRGYEVLRDVPFRLPVADIIYQHHERMDGSGYPNSLKGEQILPEARILAVADVLESMASHRPYRAALGLDAAMSELAANSGRFYDAEVVDALTRLVRDKGYQLPV